MADQAADYSSRFRAIKERFAVSDMTLSQIMCCSERHVKDICGGKARPDEAEMRKILRTFPVRREWLLLEEGPMPEASFDGLSAAQRLRKLRTSLQLSEEELAEQADLSASLIRRLEDGSIRFRTPAAEKIADACRVGVQWLLYGKAERKNNPVTASMKEWLWNHPEVRKKIAEAMEKGGSLDGNELHGFIGRMRTGYDGELRGGGFISDGGGDIGSECSDGGGDIGSE